MNTIRKKRLKLKEKENYSANKEEFRGQCIICRNSPDCTYPRDPKKPILQCEDFESYAIPIVKITKKNFSSVVNSLIKPKEKEDDTSEHLGLCKNCENRKNCTYPKPEGGVWHCNDYL